MCWWHSTLFTFRPSNSISAMKQIEACIADIKSWMGNNFWKLNDEKTEVMYISSRYYQTQINIEAFSVDDTSISPSTFVRNIGVVFDCDMSMKSQVTAVAGGMERYQLIRTTVVLCKVYSSPDVVVVVQPASTHAYITTQSFLQVYGKGLHLCLPSSPLHSRATSTWLELI